MIIFWIFLTLAFSLWNGFAAGLIWDDAKRLGPWYRILPWSAAIQGASGLTLLLALGFGYGATLLGYLDSKNFVLLQKLSYLMIIFPLLGSGFVIWIYSVREAWRTRNWIDIGVAGWNSWAQVSNTIDAVRTVPGAFGDVVEGIFEGDSDARFKLLMIALLSAFLGLLVTCWMVKKGRVSSLKSWHRSEELA